MRVGRTLIIYQVNILSPEMGLFLIYQKKEKHPVQLDKAIPFSLLRGNLHDGIYPHHNPFSALTGACKRCSALAIWLF